jgi:cytochrome c-type biogenesis protein CcmH/NrfG
MELELDEAGGFIVLIVLADVLITAAVVFLVFRSARRRREAQALNQAPTAAPGQEPLETRLAALDSLRERGIITEAEYAKARADTISSG